MVAVPSGQIAADFMGEVAKNEAGLVWIARKEWAKTRAKKLQLFIAGLKLGVADVVADPNGAQAAEKNYLKVASPISASDFDFALPPADLKY